VFAELPKGGSALKIITLNQSMGFPGGVQWDGQYMAVGSYYPPPTGKPVVYQFVVKGSKGTKVGTTALGSGASDVRQFWIQGHTIIAPNEYSSKSDVLFYDYPAGGNATAKITAGVQGPAGAVVSQAAP
jgi:hypothetical protein